MSGERVRDLIPFARVADVQRWIAFNELLDFELRTPTSTTGGSTGPRSSTPSPNTDGPRRPSRRRGRLNSIDARSPATGATGVVRTLK